MTPSQFDSMLSEWYDLRVRQYEIEKYNPRSAERASIDARISAMDRSLAPIVDKIWSNKALVDVFNSNQVHYKNRLRSLGANI